MANKKKSDDQEDIKRIIEKCEIFYFIITATPRITELKMKKKNADIALISIYACRGHNS